MTEVAWTKDELRDALEGKIHRHKSEISSFILFGSCEGKIQAYVPEYSNP